MAGVVGGGGSVPSLPPPRPKSPPEYPDLYGKRRELAKVQRLEREIGFLEEEMKSIEGLQPASRSCKEVADFVMGNVDPLIPTTKKIRRSQRFWKWLCFWCSGVSCLDVSWICCCWSPSCCECTLCSCSNPCRRCRMPKCNCCSSSCWNSKCFSKSSTSTCSWINCCAPKCPSCLITCSSLRCKCYPNCPKVNTSTSSICSCFCNKSCCCSCYPCYFCY
ncbi:hypothetical protein ACJIZ3_018846 [Penstemon smallii]|uniref:G protein gamma domain-containing protein n=1 Tax=Penstemon smallii TaxID=265156 RepID=A0ABD3SZI3_9LAMI